MKDYSNSSVQLCSDGKYRWIYAVNMWKNPSILFLVFKIFFWVFVIVWGLDKFRDDDYYDGWYEGNRVPSLIEKVCRAIIESGKVFDIETFVEQFGARKNAGNSLEDIARFPAKLGIAATCV